MSNIIDDTAQVVLSSVVDMLENPLTTKASVAKALREMHAEIGARNDN